MKRVLFILPVIAFVMGLMGLIWTWLAGTWLGTLLMPVYNLLAPLVFKVAPFITTGKYAGKLYNLAQKHPRLKKWLKKLGGTKAHPRRTAKRKT